MKKLITLLLLCLSLQASALELAGVKLADSAQLGSAKLQLNGAGIRTKFFFKVYVGALYLAQPARDAAAVLNDTGTKRVSLTMLRDVGSKRLLDGFNRGIAANNTPAQLAALKPQIEQFSAIFSQREEVKKGDAIMLDYLPGEGLRVTIDGAEVGRVAGAEFFHALLLIWFGDHPADADLERGMLGAAR